MNPRFFHVYQDTPAGREALLQTVFFCRMLGAAPVVYIPETPRFLMYFENRVVQVDLDCDPSDLKKRARWQARASEILAGSGLDAHFLQIHHRTTPELPDVPVDFDYMSCPVPASARHFVYSDLGMRRLPAVAPFSVLIPALVARGWKSLAVFYGGDEKKEGVLAAGLAMARNTGLPLDVFTRGPVPVIRSASFKAHVRHVVAGNKGNDFWMDVPPEALMIVGASGKGWFRERFFSTFKKELRSSLPGTCVFVGPQAQESYMRIWERETDS
ncbi:hypothetical protein LZ24_01818 [Desulfobotulus alkaliphilus]|uniref:Universal stress protein family protein n=1 Tax=Desulfobotulus alkaliphilus TaxID=622671 RepID=A0A562RRR8_9BACT|nr:hypothetical protein [Desulfobotulus alkaliphilus]TWI71801.1 hypothetical protein LZ24_01818 [Desulfobotulus alkaliphilus]